MLFKSESPNLTADNNLKRGKMKKTYIAILALLAISTYQAVPINAQRSNFHWIKLSITNHNNFPINVAYIYTSVYSEATPRDFSDGNSAPAQFSVLREKGYMNGFHKIEANSSLNWPHVFSSNLVTKLWVLAYLEGKPALYAAGDVTYTKTIAEKTNSFRSTTGKQGPFTESLSGLSLSPKLVFDSMNGIANEIRNDLKLEAWEVKPPNVTNSARPYSNVQSIEAGVTQSRTILVKIQ